MNKWQHAVVGLLWAALLFLVGWDVMGPPEASVPAKVDAHEQAGDEQLEAAHDRRRRALCARL